MKNNDNHNSKTIPVLTPGFKNGLLNPSNNLGDLVIHDAIQFELEQLFPGRMIQYSGLHGKSVFDYKREIGIKNIPVIIGGSNALGWPYLRTRSHWKVGVNDIISNPSSILMGIGWSSDDVPLNYLSKLIISRVLDRDSLHSVRDLRSKRNIELAGLRNVIYTACPTLWSLANAKNKGQRCSTATDAIITITDYRKNVDVDKSWIQLVLGKYKNVFAFPQGSKDLDYLRNIKFPGEMLNHSMEEFKKFISTNSEKMDFIGTRLHGGIFCLKLGMRTLILEVDNRSRELASETRLPTADRNDLVKISNWINGSEPVNLNLPTDNINIWKASIFRRFN